MPPNATGFRELLQQLVASIAATQARLDEAWRQDVADFARVLDHVEPLGLATIARSLAPSALSLDHTHFSCGIHLSRARGSEFALHVTPLSLGFTRKYRRLSETRQRITVDVVRVPLPPGASPSLLDAKEIP